MDSDNQEPISRNENSQRSFDQEQHMEESERNESHININYDLNPADYLREITKISEKRLSRQKGNEFSQNQQSKDQQVQSIINEVLRKRKMKSRLSNSNVSASDYDGLNHRAGHQASLRHIDEVNRRLKKENEQLKRNIKKLTKDLSKMASSKQKGTNQPMGSLKMGEVIESRTKQLQKLRNRLQKAYQTNSRMQLEITKFKQSRRTNSHKKSKSNIVIDDQIKINCPECEIRARKQTQRPVTKFTSPDRKDYYSPIMEFQQYSLKNEPTISMYDNSLHKTSQFGIQLMPTSQLQIEKVAMVNSSTQDRLGADEITREEDQLDLEIKRLEEVVRKNNGTISKHESLLFRQIL